MSVQALTCALAVRGVSASEKLLLLALANYADDKMRCWPSQSRLSADTCLSERTVRTLLIGLEGKAMISRRERRREDGSRSTDIITLHFAGVVTTGAEQQPEIISGGAEIISGGVGKSFPGGGEMVSGLTTFEPSLNHEEEQPAAPLRRAPTPAKPTAQEVDTIWALQPVINGKRRSTRPDVERALTAAMGRGGAMAQIEAGCRAYYRLDDCQRDGGQFAMGAARLLERDRWQEFGGAPEAPALGADWSEDRWRHAVALYREGVPWKPELGPPPDTAGCRAPRAALEPRTVLPFPSRQASA